MWIRYMGNKNKKISATHFTSKLFYKFAKSLHLRSDRPFLIMHTKTEVTLFDTESAQSSTNKFNYSCSSSRINIYRFACCKHSLKHIHLTKLYPPVTRYALVTLALDLHVLLQQRSPWQQQILNLLSLPTTLIGSRSWGNGVAPEDSWAKKATKVRARKAGRMGRGKTTISLILAEEETSPVTHGPQQIHLTNL